MIDIDWGLTPDEKEIQEQETEKKELLNNSNVIRNISFDQSEILWNIMNLYNNGEAFECDMTASELKFYGERKGSKYVIPEPKILFDVYPMQDKIQKIVPFKKLPLDDGSIGSIVVDLPFVISPKTAPSLKENKENSNLIFKRFSSFYPVGEMYENYYWWIKESFRVLKEGGICVFKTQSTISGGLSHWTSDFSFMCAQKLGFYVIDEFLLEAKARLISGAKIKKQQHARKFTSTFWVFKKDSKMANKTNCFKLIEMCETQELEGKVWEIK